jgi:hypothetical protein
VIVGEFERAFSARQFLRVASTLACHGIQVWLPEVDGPVDPADPAHRALVALLGAKAKHEVVRARHRTLAAMRAQTVEQGRFLGGRPPYGYRWWTPGHTRIGRRLRGVSGFSCIHARAPTSSRVAGISANGGEAAASRRRSRRRLR